MIDQNSPSAAPDSPDEHYEYGQQYEYGEQPTGPLGSAAGSAPSAPVPGQAPQSSSPQQHYPSQPYPTPQSADPQTYPSPPVYPATPSPRTLPVRIPNPLTALAAAGLGYAAAWITAGIVLALLTAAIAVAGSSAAGSGIDTGTIPDIDGSDVPSAGDLFSGFWALFCLPFQMVALAFFGRIHTSADLGDFGSLTVSVHAVPGLVLAVFVVAVVAFQRFWQRRRPVHGILPRLAVAAVAAVALAIVADLAALIFAPVSSTELGTSRIDAASPATFFAALAITFASVLLGLFWDDALDRWRLRLSEWRTALTVAVGHVLFVFAVSYIIFIPVTLIVSAVDGSIGTGIALILATPLLAGQLLAGTAGWTALSAISVQAGASAGLLGSDSMAEHVTVFQTEWYVWLPALLIGLVSLLVAAVAWAEQRPAAPTPATKVETWFQLPAAYLVVSLILTAIMHVGASGGAGIGGSARASISLAPWTFLLFVVWAVVVDLLARFAVPYIGPYLPVRTRAWGRAWMARAGYATPTASAPAPVGTIAPQETPSDDPVPAPAAATGTGAATAGAGAPSGTPTPQGAGSPAPAWQGAAAYGPPAAAPPAPMSPRAKRTLKLTALIGGGALVLVVAAAITITVLGRTVYSPSKQAEAYLDALQDGDAAAAIEIAPPDLANGQRVAMTDEVYGAAERRIDGYTIDDVQTSGRTATVEATVTQDGESTEVSYELTRRGNSALIFPKWTLEAPDPEAMYVTVPEGQTDVTINGVDVDLSGLTPEQYGEDLYTVPVLPGSYEIALPGGNDFVASEPATAFVSVNAAEEGSTDGNVELVYEPTDKALEEINKQIKDTLDECAASTEPAPDGCPFAAYDDSSRVSDVTWSISTYPEVTELSSGGAPWTFYSEDMGDATFTYDYSYSWDTSGQVQSYSSDSSFYIQGSATVSDDGKSLEVTFE